MHDSRKAVSCFRLRKGPLPSCLAAEEQQSHPAEKDGSPWPEGLIPQALPTLGFSSL